MAKTDKGTSKSGKKEKAAKKAKKADKGTAAKVTKPSAKKPAKASAKDVAGKAAKSIQTLTQNPLIADVVAATLVSMAAALKDNKKAQELAGGAGEQLKALSKNAAKDGNIMWDLARDVGRRTLEAIVAEQGKSGKGAKAR